MPAYATRTDFEAYAEGWVTDDPQALERLLERASDDVDEVVGPIPYRSNGRKLDPATDLDDVGTRALMRATCAQALHRFRFVEPAAARASSTTGAVKSVKGPDFETVYQDAPAGPLGVSGTGRLSPELRRELAPLAYLRVRGARARA